MVSVEVTCDCGNSAMVRDGERSFRQPVLVGRRQESVPEFELLCRCGMRFRIRAQRNHFHVTQLSGRRDTSEIAGAEFTKA